jgi:uncharacterized protein YjiS (DUF1127 family)
MATAAAPHYLRRMRKLVQSFGRTLVLWRRRLRERDEIAAMSERDLLDARLPPGQARWEASKPFWRA